MPIRIEMRTQLLALLGMRMIDVASWNNAAPNWQAIQQQLRTTRKSTLLVHGALTCLIEAL